MPHIELKSIGKFVCNDINLSIRDGEFLVLLGSNGSGKTTLLNIIAGLVDYTGTVLFDGNEMNKVPANQRRVSYLFQGLHLFPHLTVRDNIAYGLRLRKQSPDMISASVDELMRLTKIEALADRYPKHLSGGERQRTALARALATEPEVLLLDEPLSSLDARSAKYLRIELKQIHRKLGITTVYVTHNLQEAEEMADRIAVIHDGRLEQVGTPDEIFFSPVSRRVSDFIGTPNILNCDYCKPAGHGIMEVGCDGMPVIVADNGNPVRKIAVLPSDVYISGNNPPGPEINHYKGRVTDIDITRDSVRILVRVEKNSFLVEVPHHTWENLNFILDQEVYLILRIGRIRTYE
ncbi:MAG: ABC transporter ATP-binding protein [Dehalococcoidales bacterium]|nr:ABC transporter ATP-binding protein [Dehalococcoidales bacterium]